ncbi:MAG: hypothetical protein R3D29_10580 [Nitratireductor sp.]
MAERVDFGLPFRLNDDGLVRLDDEGRACHPVAVLQRFAAMDCCIMPGPIGEHGNGGRRRYICHFEIGTGFDDTGTCTNSLNFHCLDDQPLVLEDEAELLRWICSKAAAIDPGSARVTGIGVSVPS